MIEDEELRRLFRTETEEHLQRLEAGLLRLEQTPGESLTLDEVRRELHSLKGTGRMLGLTAFEALAHLLETFFRSTEPMGAARIDAASAAIGALRALAAEAITGQPAEVDIAAFAARLGQPPPEMASSMREQAAPPPPQPPAEPEPTLRLDTVRIETRRLEQLMTLAGELTVVRERFNRTLASVVALDDWVRELGRPGAREPKEAWHRLAQRVRELSAALTAIHGQLDRTGEGLATGIRRISLVPFSPLFRLFPRMVRDLGREQGKEVRIAIEGEQTAADRRIVEEMKDPLMHLLRNAVVHGIERPDERELKGKPAAGTIYLRAFGLGNHVELEVADDGRGLDTAAVTEEARRRGLPGSESPALSPHLLHDVLFSSGFSTVSEASRVAGRGMGLAVVRANAERLKGQVSFSSYPGAGFSVRIRLPSSLATLRVLLVQVSGEMYGLPVEAVHFTRRIRPTDRFAFEGGEAIRDGDTAVSLRPLAKLLGRPAALATDEPVPCIVLEAAGERIALQVDSVYDEQEVLLKSYSDRLGPVRHLYGATILDTGQICLILDPGTLVEAGQRKTELPGPLPEPPPVRPRRVLLVEDSITTRAQERRILEGAGYQVITAADGLEAIRQLAGGDIDAVVSDVLMPNLGGIELTRRLRQDPRYRELPVVLVTTLASDADRRRGLEAGANAYVPKHGFEQEALLETLARLL